MLKGFGFGYLLFLLLDHPVEDGRDPLLKLAIVVVGHEQVAYPVEPLLAQCLAVELKVAHVGRRETLDKVLLYPTGRTHEHVHHAVLHEVADDVAHAARDQVGRVRQEHGALGRCAHGRVAPFVRLVLLDGLVAQSPLELIVFFFFVFFFLWGGGGGGW